MHWIAIAMIQLFMNITIAQKRTFKFTYTGSVIEWRVPQYAYSATFKLWGAGGGAASTQDWVWEYEVPKYGGKGGAGGFVAGQFNVTSNQYLYMAVGEGGNGKSGTEIMRSRSFPSGGGSNQGIIQNYLDCVNSKISLSQYVYKPAPSSEGGNGGGRSQVSLFNSKQSNSLLALQNKENIMLIAAGGGGGGTGPNDRRMGRGGGGLKGNGDEIWNFGGTQTNGGAPPSNYDWSLQSSPGSFLKGGSSGCYIYRALENENTANPSWDGWKCGGSGQAGAGGDGFFGGSSGTSKTTEVSGGAGGSSYINSSVFNSKILSGGDGGLPPAFYDDPDNNYTYGKGGWNLSVEVSRQETQQCRNTYFCNLPHCKGQDGLIVMTVEFNCPNNHFLNGTECMPCSNCPISTQYVASRCTPDADVSCAECPDNTISSKERRSYLDCICKPGFYGSILTPFSSSCQPCPSNKFCPRPLNNSGLVCPCI
jgi:hypothetical protein